MDNFNLEELYKRHKLPIYSLCIKLTMSKDFAEDLFSETWTKVAEKFHQIDSTQNTFNWIYTICLNIYRREKLKHSIYSFVAEYAPVLENTFRNTDTIDFIVEEKESSKLLNQALSKLKDKYRVPVVLFYFKDLSYEDISEIMGLSMSTVKYRLHQAKKILKTELEKYGK